jgi:hypothetical protein
MKTVYVIWGVIVLALLGGWIANVVKLINMGFDQVTGMMVARSIGVFVAPLGGVLGFL